MAPQCSGVFAWSVMISIIMCVCVFRLGDDTFMFIVLSFRKYAFVVETIVSFRSIGTFF